MPSPGQDHVGLDRFVNIDLISLILNINYFDNHPKPPPPSLLGRPYGAFNMQDTWLGRRACGGKPGRHTTGSQVS